jgi:hypothetical protein
MPSPPKSLMRFVQVRRLTPSEEAPPASCRAPAAAFGFSEALPGATYEVIVRGDRRAGAIHHRKLRDSLDERGLAAGRLALSLSRASMTNEQLTVADMRTRIDAWAEENRVKGTVATSKEVEALTAWATALVTLRRWLRPDADIARIEPVKALRGVALLRMAAAQLAGTCVVRKLLAGQRLVLPDVPTSDSRPDPEQGPVATPVPGPITGTPGQIERTASAGTLSSELTATSSGSLLEPATPDSWLYVDPWVPALSAEARVLGRGDLMIVRTAHLEYRLGDISHVENVLASERRARTHEIDTSTSETVTESSTSLSETSTELETTEHNSLERATQEASSSASSIAVGVSVSGGLGPVQAGIDIDASHSTTTSESNSSAVSFARDVTEKASELLRSEEETKRTTTTRTRIVETNEHSFDNSDGEANIAGVYCWVDKVNEAQVFNYGERLLFEFIIPEPAAQHVAQASAGTAAGAPVPPEPFELEAKDLTAGNYVAKAAAYSAQGLEPPPPDELFVATSFVDPAAKPYDYPAPEKKEEETPQPEWGYASYAKEVTVPEGYEATVAYVTVTWANSFYISNRDKKQDIEVAVGDDKSGIITDEDATDVHEITIDHVGEGPLPVLVSTDQERGLAVGVRIRCERTADGLAAWQLRTYETIQRAYLDQQAAYDSALRVQQSREAFVSMLPESVNRGIELRELKRGCQTLLTGQDFDLYGAVSFPEDDLPRIDRAESLAEAKHIQFFEDCFEWDNLTYLFYPYQWAGRPRWPDLLSRSSGDALHEAFLQAGAARVVVPVREGYEHAVGIYMQTSEVPEWVPRPWKKGDQSPYPPIEDLIADANDRPGPEVAIGEPWEVVTPTSLVYLQAGGELNPVETP